MTTIYKYPIQITDTQVIQLPRHAKILTVQLQGETPCLWAMVEPEWHSEPREIRTHGTGHPIPFPESLLYIGTYQITGLVFHVFEKRRKL